MQQYNRALPQCLDALEAADAERIELLDHVATYMKEVRAAGFQRVAVKPLVTLGFRLALREVRTHARAEGFEPEDLEDLRTYRPRRSGSRMLELRALEAG